MTEFEMEKAKLDDTLAIVQTVLSEEKDALAKLYKEFIGDREELWRMADIKNIHIRNLEASLDKPYFARIDFTYNDEEDKVHTIYIGKNGISRDAKIVVTDWRAPISSLYYDAEIGKCSFIAPGGIIKGNMSLKRQYEIEHGELLEYFDVDLVSNDALLQKYLNTNNDARLKSIVATIQKEQNEVIRKPLSDDLIVQGVAGSGKTTVALHRIAYLVYNYMQNIQQNQFLVIGPNTVFLKYIKSVLPELDVSGVSQYTFEQFAKDYIDEEIQINSSDQKVNASIAGKINHDIDKFKCSVKYKNMIDQFLMIYFRNLTNNDLMIGNFKVLDKKSIQNIFATTDKEVFTSLASRIEMTIDLLCRYIEDHNDEIISKYDSYAYELFKNATIEQQNELRRKFAKEKEEIKKNARNSLRKYFAKGKVDATKLYKTFVSTINDFDIYNYAHLNTLKKDTLANLKKNTCDFEDLPALIHIKRKLCHNKRYNQIRHVVVDEAQDLGEFNFMALRDSLPSATFSIFGDLAQSIYDYRGIDNWQEVNDVMFENEGSIINFTKSYRTTAEIMRVADDISESIGLGKSDLVVRHGNPVSFTKCDSKDEIAISIADKIIQYKEKGYKNIAVISKTDLLSHYINDELLARGVEVPNVSATDDLSDDKFRACTISNQLAKGLEFDAVIINNANEDIYSSSSTLDMKLLYVAVTRALHELDVVYTGELVKPLQKSLRMDAKKM